MLNLQEEKLKAIIKYEADVENGAFRDWFLKQFKADVSNSCTVEEFAVYFLNTLRQCTEVHLKPSSTETPICQTPVRARKLENVREDCYTPMRSKFDLSEQNASTPTDKNNFDKDISSHSTPRQSKSVDCSGSISQKNTSTPVRRNVSNSNSRRQSSTPNSGNKSTSHSFCLGDFLVTNNSKQNRSQKKKTVRISSQQNVQQTQTTKPKKRVQPICLTKEVESSNSSSIFAGESSFSTENNILKISNTELEDKEQCAILAARKFLKLNADEIAKELNNSSVHSVPVINDVVTEAAPAKETMLKDFLNLKNLENNMSLKRLAKVYTLIIDLNLTTNILNELSFLLNLLNAPYPSSNPDEITEHLKELHLNDENCIEGLECLEDLSHAVFFAILCLKFEKESLALLDTKSLSVVLIGERFSYLPDDVKTYLLEIHQHKQQLVAENPFCNTSLFFESKPCNVYFQQDQDSRVNFTSYQEFANFRVQRDLFCRCFKIWDSNHLNPAWKFSEEVTPKIREIFEHSENCINMAHLAKLFVSQLLLTASNTTSPEEIGLDVDMQKFSKLTQRLIAPSQFSVDYQFPRSEAFFRDFILEARSLAFAEQLKMELYAELISKNDSSFDHINISKADNDAYDQELSIGVDMNSANIVVRPDVLNSMLILAKFLGFTTSLPYNNNGTNVIPPSVEKNQIKLRSLMQSTLDISVILEQGIQQDKLLITIPWLVQYFAMLDNITLHLDHYMKALRLMFALYSCLGIEQFKSFNKSSLFIIKLCLGWLFESKQFIAEQYYDFRRISYAQSSIDVTNELAFVRNKLSRHIIADNNISENKTLNAYLESILPIACPFLAEFRVSIMPANYAQTKNASRSGRYRHITTRIAELPSTAQVKESIDIQSSTPNQLNKVQSTLIQAFLQSQNSSTRNLINFCIERCYKCVVKDGQLKILLPAKSNADNLVNEITSSEYRLVYNSIKTIYNDAYLQAKTNWDDSLDEMLQKRLRNALESLLPEETTPVLKRTYFMIIKQETKQKVAQWFYANIISENFFCSNLQEMANKVCSANKNKVQLGSSQLVITKESPSISSLIDELQYWLYCTSIRVDRFKGPEPLIGMLRQMTDIFENILPSLLYNLLSAGVIQLLQHIIAQHCNHLTEELLVAACNVWLHPNMKSALENSASSNICIYDALVTLAFIQSLGTRTESFNKLGHLFVIMIKKEIISLNYANDLFLSLFKYELHPRALAEISNMLKTIAKETATVPQHKTHCDNSDNENYKEDDDDIDKSNLFMDMLADLSRDIDFF